MSDVAQREPAVILRGCRTGLVADFVAQHVGIAAVSRSSPPRLGDHVLPRRFGPGPRDTGRGPSTWACPAASRACASAYCCCAARRCTAKPVQHRHRIPHAIPPHQALRRVLLQRSQRHHRRQPGPLRGRRPHMRRDRNPRLGELLASSRQLVSDSLHGPDPQHVATYGPPGRGVSGKLVLALQIARSPPPGNDTSRRPPGPTKSQASNSSPKGTLSSPPFENSISSRPSLNARARRTDWRRTASAGPIAAGSPSGLKAEALSPERALYSKASPILISK